MKEKSTTAIFTKRITYRHLLIIITSVIAVSSWLKGPALAQDNHYKLVEIYTHMASLAFFAQKNCPDIRADRTKLLVLRQAANISDNEEKMIDDNIQMIVSEIRAQYSKVGQLAWCSDTYSGIGPSGKLLPGLISRSQNR